MVAPRLSAFAARAMPVLAARVRGLAQLAVRLPTEAAQEMVQAVRDGARRGVDPYGEPLARTKEGQPFDPQHHVADSYKPEVRGTDAMLVSRHPGARPLQTAYRGRPARPLHPSEGAGLGTWRRRIERMHRRLFRAVARTA